MIYETYIIRTESIGEARVVVERATDVVLGPHENDDWGDYFRWDSADYRSSLILIANWDPVEREYYEADYPEHANVLYLNLARADGERVRARLVQDGRVELIRTETHADEPASNG